jgi:hypothetical protein
VYDRRSPNARLQRARELASNWEAERTNHRYEDQMVLAYARFLNDLQQLDGRAHDRYLAARPVLSEVHHLAAVTSPFSVGSRSRLPVVSGLPDPQETDLPVSPAMKDRALVRAYILGGADSREIAQSLDLREEAVRMYEYLAFDVRARLSRRGWLHNYVFGESVTGGTHVSDFERLCLLAVYKHGLDGLRRLLFIDDDRAAFVENMRDQLRVDFAAKANLALATMPLNSHTMPELLTGHRDWEKTERELQLKTDHSKDRNRADADDDLKDSVMSALGAVRFQVFDSEVDSSSTVQEERHSDQAFVQALQAVLRENSQTEELARA